MTTERKAPAAKKAAAKKNAQTTSESTPQSGLRRARAFALQHNFGLSSRVREMLDAHKAELKILVDENLPISKIQIYIQQTFGPKIGAKALSAYVAKTFPRAESAPEPSVPAKSASTRKR